MHNIESEFHSLLEEIAPNAHSTDEQARIIAEASAIFKRIASRRTAKVNNSRLKEAQMTESILQAMKSISEYEIKQVQPIEIYFMGESGNVYKSDSLKNLLPLLFDKKLL